MAEFTQDDEPNRLVYHETLRYWSPLSKAESKAARRFLNRLLDFPILTAGIVALLFLFYIAQLWQGWPFATIMPGAFAPVGIEEDLAMWAVGARMGVLSRSAVLGGELWRLLSCTLLHASLLHVVGNSVVLFLLGRTVENAYGRLAFLFAYAGAGASGAALSILVSGHDSLGASGAILGMLGMTVAMGLRYRDRIPKALLDFFRTDSWVFVLLVGVMSAMPSVDWAGHAGGFLFGLLVGLIWPAKIMGSRPSVPLRILGPVLGGVALVAYLGTVGLVVKRTFELEQVMPRAERMELQRSIREREVDRTELLATRLLDRVPDDPSWLEARVMLLMWAQRVEEAGALMLAADQPEEPEWLQRRADLMMYMERWDVAVSDLRRLREIEPRAADSAGFNNGLAWSLLKGYGGDDEVVREALALAKLALNERPKDPAIRNTWAYALYLSGRYRDALVVVRKLVASQPEPRDDAFLLVLCLVATDREAEAVEAWKKWSMRFAEAEFREAAEVAMEEAGWSLPGAD